MLSINCNLANYFSINFKKKQVKKVGRNKLQIGLNNLEASKVIKNISPRSYI